MSIFESKTWVSDWILTLPSLWGEIYGLAWNQPSTQTEIHMMQTRPGLKPQNSDLDLDFKWWDWGWGNNPPNPHPSQIFLKLANTPHWFQLIEITWGIFSWDTNLTLPHRSSHAVSHRCVTLSRESLHKALKEIVRLFNVHDAAASERGKEEREKESRDAEKPVLFLAIQRAAKYFSFT